MISLQFMALLLSVNFVASVAEEREIYLVLMEGHPVAFHSGYPPREDGRRVKPINRFGLKTCCKTKEKEHGCLQPSTARSFNWLINTLRLTVQVIAQPIHSFCRPNHVFEVYPIEMSHKMTYLKRVSRH